ncbi:MAG TPA: enoyl-ACP reductase FabV [Gammaproteobacteria bacterium]|nr:enoyl-ACP reductase FabV [Gammaproteobacteria bacterium]HET7588079.1 enoyl-ACP reductase FabV [Gammaproteobacteria bacterium]
MIIHPRTWGFICTTAHPLGCEKNVLDQIEATQRLGTRTGGPQRVLVIGASTGYGLAARITAAFGFGAATLGVFFEKPGKSRKPGSAGWYNSAAFDRFAKQAGLQSLSINGDAFSDETRAQAIDLIREQMDGPIDLVVYSLAAPARRLPDSGERIQTALKPIGEPFSGTTIDTDHDRLKPVTVEPATEHEIADTVTVMGGEDWALWTAALADAGVLAADARTVAFSYVGPELTWPIYRHGTIGRAKAHLEETATELCERFSDSAFARVAILKSIVTQASAAIPVIPLYVSLVFKVMKDKGLHENAIDQQNRLFRDYLYGARGDSSLRLRLDDRELRDDVQAECRALWPQVTDDNLFDLTDYGSYKREFLRLFGFARDDVDYDADVDPQVEFG